MPAPVISPTIGPVVFVERDQLRRTMHGRRFSAPTFLKAMSMAVPDAPPIFDHSKAEQIKFPMLGNDQVGDCYYTACAHGSQCFTGQVGTQAVFDVKALIKRYLQISGGDNGLDDRTMLPEWVKGIVGPNGPRKVLAEMVIDPNDSAAVKLAAWRFYGLIWTCALFDRWFDQAGPGVIWDAGGRPNPRKGHAMYITGVDASGYYDVRTWGISPPVKLTRRGLLASDSELIVAFSLDMFNANGLTADGLSYETMASIWAACGGPKLPPSPFPPPVTPLPVDEATDWLQL